MSSSRNADRSLLIDEDDDDGIEQDSGMVNKDHTTIYMQANNDDDEENLLTADTRDTPAQDGSPKKSWYAKLWDKSKTVLKFTSIAFLSVAAALPTAMNAAGGDDFTPAEAKTKWPLLSRTLKAFAITRGVSSLSINTILNFIYLPLAAGQLLTGFRNIKSHPIPLIVALLAGIATALASFALGTAAFEALSGAIISNIFALLGSGISFAQNFAGAYGLINFFMDKFSVKAKIQMKAVNKLYALDKLPKDEKEALLTSLQNELDSFWDEEKYTQANDAEKRILLSETLFQLNKHLAQNEVFYRSDLVNHWKENLALAVDLSLAVGSGVLALWTFTQIGYDGAVALESFGSKRNIEKFHPILKILIGAPTGLASVAFTAWQSFLLRSTAANIISKMIREPRSIPAELAKIILLAPPNYFASSSMANVGRQIAENNVLAIPGPNTGWGKAFIYSNQVSAAIINVNTTIGEAVLHGETSPSKLNNKIPRVQDILILMEATLANPLTAKDALSLISLFGKSMAGYEKLATQAEDEDAAAVSTIGFFKRDMPIKTPNLPDFKKSEAKKVQAEEKSYPIRLAGIGSY